MASAFPKPRPAFSPISARSGSATFFRQVAPATSECMRSSLIWHPDSFTSCGNTPVFDYPVYVVHSANADRDVLGSGPGYDQCRLSRRHAFGWLQLRPAAEQGRGRCAAGWICGRVLVVAIRHLSCPRLLGTSSRAAVSLRRGDFTKARVTTGSPLSPSRTRSWGESTAPDQRCRRLVVIAARRFLLRGALHGPASLGWRCWWYRVVQQLIWRRSWPRRSRDGLDSGPAIRSRAFLRLIGLRGVVGGCTATLWRPGRPGGASRGVRLGGPIRPKPGMAAVGR